MATIANQIKRISDSRDILRNKGIALGLYVPIGTYWDDSTNTNITTTSATALKTTDQIDKVAAAFNQINVYHNTEIPVELEITKSGTTTVGKTTPLDTGFYSNAIIKPYIKVNEVEDLIINVQSLANQSITAKSGEFKPGTGFNYLDVVTYTVTDGAISATNAEYDNTGVTAKVATSGWLAKDATQKITVVTSAITSKIGSNTATNISSGNSINPNPTQDTVLTISKGIYGSDRTITIKSLGSQTGGTAKAEDILDGKEAWVAGVKVTGSMPNKGGTSTSAVSTNANGIKQIGDVLAIVPQLGYYNTYSNIITSIKYNPTRVFNTTNNSATDVETLTSQTYYETIPAGYYSQDIKKKITVRAGSGSVSIDYTTHKATFNVTKAGWFSGSSTATISAGPARYKQTQADLEDSDHMYIISPSKDQDGTKTSYLTEVTIDNSLIYDLLSEI